MAGGLEEPGEVLVEDEGDAGEVAEGGHDAAGLELREEAGGEAGEAAELDEAHGAFEAEALDALAQLGGREKGFGGDGVDGERVGWRGWPRRSCAAAMSRSSTVVSAAAIGRSSIQGVRSLIGCSERGGTGGLSGGEGFGVEVLAEGRAWASRGRSGVGGGRARNRSRRHGR